MFFLANKHSSFSYFKINKLREQFSFLAYLMMGVFILVSSNYTSWESSYNSFFSSYPFPDFTSQVPSKFIVQLKTLANLKTFSILDFCSVSVCCTLSGLLGKKYSWREKPKPPLLVPITWHHQVLGQVVLSASLERPSFCSFPWTHRCSTGPHTEVPSFHIRSGQPSAHHTFSVIHPGRGALRSRIPPSTSWVPHPFFITTTHTECLNLCVPSLHSSVTLCLLATPAVPHPKLMSPFFIFGIPFAAPYNQLLCCAVCTGISTATFFI